MPRARVTLEMIPWPAAEADNLEEAARIMEDRGWCRGRAEDERGHVDAVRAYDLACRRSRPGYGLAAVSLVLDTDLSIPDWNDANGQSRRAVVAAFRKTARELRKVARSIGHG